MKKWKKAAALAVVLVIVLSAAACSFNIGSIDESGYINDVTETAVKACVKIETENYTNTQTPEGPVPFGVLFQGSGVIFKKENGVYYALTNNHVTEKLAEYREYEIFVYDCYGNEYTGSLESSSASDDLAVVSFSDTEGYDANLNVLSIAETNAAAGATVASVGAPDGQFNAVTIGKIKRYSTVILTEEVSASDVRYPVVCHTAITHQGSSGGMLVDKNLRIVGVNYAGATDETSGKFYEGYAIPAEKIREFLAT